MIASISFDESSPFLIHSQKMKSAEKNDAARGERITYVRKEILKMDSQEALAKALTAAGTPVTRGAVGNWERGANIGIDKMTAICGLSDIDLNWLAYNKGERPSAKEGPPAQIPSDKISDALIALLPKINEESRQQLLNLAIILANPGRGSTSSQ